MKLKTIALSAALSLLFLLGGGALSRGDIATIREDTRRLNARLAVLEGERRQLTERVRARRAKRRRAPARSEPETGEASRAASRGRAAEARRAAVPSAPAEAERGQPFSGPLFELMERYIALGINPSRRGWGKDLPAETHAELWDLHRQIDEMSHGELVPLVLAMMKAPRYKPYSDDLSKLLNGQEWKALSPAKLAEINQAILAFIDDNSDSLSYRSKFGLISALKFREDSPDLEAIFRGLAPLAKEKRSSLLSYHARHIILSLPYAPARELVFDLLEDPEEDHAGLLRHLRPSPRASEALARFIAAGDPAVRKAAYDEVSCFPRDPLLRAALEERARSGEQGGLPLERLERALKRQGDDTTAAVLEGLAADATLDVELRGMAQRAARRIREP